MAQARLLDSGATHGGTAIDLNALVTPSIGLIVAILIVAVVVLAVLVIVLLRRSSRLDARLTGMTRGSEGRSLEAVLDAHLDKVFAVGKGLDDVAARTAVLEATLRASVPARRSRPLQPVRGDRGEPELRAGPARREGRRLGALESARADGDAGLRQGHHRGPLGHRAVRRGDRGDPAGDGPDRLAVTAAGDGPRMAPTAITPAPVQPSTVKPAVRAPRRRRREPGPLDQLPAWRDLVPVMDPALTTSVEPGLAALLGRPQRRPATGGHARGGAAAGRRRRGDRQDPGHHPPHRLADRHAPCAAVRDPGPDLHRQGGRGDGASASTSSSRTATRTRRSPRSTPSATRSSASTPSSSDCRPMSGCSRAPRS